MIGKAAYVYYRLAPKYPVPVNKAQHHSTRSFPIPTPSLMKGNNTSRLVGRYRIVYASHHCDLTIANMIL